MESLKESIENDILRDRDVCPQVKENILRERYAGSGVESVIVVTEKISFEKVKAAYYQATNLQGNPSDIIQRLYQELNS